MRVTMGSGRWRGRLCGAALLTLCAGLLLAQTTDAADRTAVGIFRDWGAFREGPADSPTRCFAIAAPPRGSPSAGHGAFASVASWPARRVRGQVAIHLSYPARDGAPVTLAIGDASFALTGRGQDAWAHDRHADARIVAAMRSGSSMSISSVGIGGHPFADGYRLRGAASAIDAAALACPLR